MSPTITLGQRRQSNTGATAIRAASIHDRTVDRSEVQPGESGFVSWWLQHTQECLPRSLCDRLGRQAESRALILVANPASAGDMIGLIFRLHGRETLHGHFGSDPSGVAALRVAARERGRLGTILLRLPHDSLLERVVSLPLAAERDPAGVLACDMDRLSPFPAASVFWDWAVQRRDPAHGRLHVRLSLVRKTAVQPLIEALTRAGLSPSALEFVRPGTAPRVIPLRSPARQRRSAWTTTVAASLCISLAVAAMVFPFVAQSVVRSRIEQTIGALQPSVAEAEALRRRLLSNAAGTDVVGTEYARVGDPLAVLSALTDALPDDTWIDRFSLRQGQLEIEGQSAAAARLIGALSADPTFRNPAFAAPVTRAEGGTADLFSIRSEVAP